MSAPNPVECAKIVSDLLKSHRFKRATMSDPYFRQLMCRGRIEGSFLAKLNKAAEKSQRPFAVSKINSEYVAARASQRHFKDDCEDEDTDD